MSDQYILTDAGEPVVEHDMYKWGEWFERSSELRRVGNDTIGDCRVSTVFLGLNHNWEEGPPILWETMVFGGPMDQERWAHIPDEQPPRDFKIHDCVVGEQRNGRTRCFICGQFIDAALI